MKDEYQDFQPKWVQYDFEGNLLDCSYAMYVDNDVYSKTTKGSQWQLRLAEDRQGVVLFHKTPNGGWEITEVSMNGWLYGTGPKVRDWHDGYVGDHPMFDYRRAAYSNELVDDAFPSYPEPRQLAILQEEREYMELVNKVAQQTAEALDQLEGTGVTELALGDGIISVEMANGNTVIGNYEDVARFFNAMDNIK